MKIAAIVLAFLSTVFFSRISAMPIDTEAPESDCIHSTRTLREGLEMLRRDTVCNHSMSFFHYLMVWHFSLYLQIPRNIPKVFYGDLFTFKDKVTALEFVCEALDNFQGIGDEEQTGNSNDSSVASQLRSVDILRQQTCSWVCAFILFCDAVDLSISLMI